MVATTRSVTDGEHASATPYGRNTHTASGDGAAAPYGRNTHSTSGDGTAAAARTARVATAWTGNTITVALIIVAFVLALGGPATLVLVAPLVFGVPHVASDVRYLIVRGPLRANALMAIVVPLALIVGQRATAIAGGAFSPHVELGLGFAAIAGGAISARSSRPRTIAVLALVVAVAVPALATPRIAMLVLLHAHNLVGIALWLAWTGSRASALHDIDRTAARPPSGHSTSTESTAHSTSAQSTFATTQRALVVVAIAACLGLVFSGACDSIAAELDGLARTVAPDVAAPLAGRIALAFAFLQAVHYIAWLVLIPRAIDARPLRGLARDFGRAGVVALAIATLVVPVAALAGNAAHVRELYLSVVVFHAWLEVAVAAYLVARRA